MTRRTARTVFADSRADADRARQDLLMRVGLRRPPVSGTDDPIAYVSRGLPDFQQAMDTARRALDAFGVTMEQAMLAMPCMVSGMQVPEDARPPTTRWLCADYGYLEQLHAAYSGVDSRQLVEGNWAEIDELGSPLTWDPPGPDAYRPRPGTVRAFYDPVYWPDEGYPCQLCWARGRWPWEPARACPANVNVESTYCKEHRGKDVVLGPFGAGNSFVFTYDTVQVYPERPSLRVTGLTP